MSADESGDGDDGDSGPGTREVAYRLFAAEFEDCDFQFSESDEERAPNFVITPTGGRVNRLFLVGVLTELEPVNESMLRARIVDPTGAFVVYAGQYQPQALSFLERTEPPAFLAVTGKARTYQPEDTDVVYSSVRPESISEVDAETRDRWVVSTAEQTLERVGVMASAIESGLSGEPLREHLESEGVAPALAQGTALAREHYGTTAAYLDALRDLSLDATRVVANERDEAGSLDIAPDEGGAVDAAALRTEGSPAVATTGDTGTTADAEPAAAGSEPTGGEVTTGASASESDGTTTSTATAADDAASAGTGSADSEESGPSAQASAASGSPSEHTASAEGGEASAAEPADTATESEAAEPTDTATESEAAEPADTTTESEPAEPMSGGAPGAESGTPAGDAGAAGGDDGEDLGDFEPGEFDAEDLDEDPLSEDEREQVEEEYGTEFSTGTEVESEPDLEPEPTAESAADAEAAAESESAGAEPDTDSTPEPTADAGGEAAAETNEPDVADEPDEDVDLDEAVMDAMRALDEGDGAPTEEVVARVADRTGAAPEAVEDAVQDALMGGQCYEPEDGVLMPI
jgi:RPA family protein